MSEFEVLDLRFREFKGCLRVSGSYISNFSVEGLKGKREEMSYLVQTLRELGGAFTFMLSISSEPLRYGVSFSVSSKKLNECRVVEKTVKVCLSSLFGEVKFRDLPASWPYAIYPIGHLKPEKRYRNSLIAVDGGKFRAATFLLARKIEDSRREVRRGGLERFIEGLIKSRVSVVYNVALKPSGGILSLVRPDGLSSSCVLTVVGGKSKTVEEAFLLLKSSVSVVKSSFQAVFPGFRVEEVNRWSLLDVARHLLARKPYFPVKLPALSLTALVDIPVLDVSSYLFEPLAKAPFKPPRPTEFEGRKEVVLGEYVGEGGKLTVKLGLRDLPLHVGIFGLAGSGKTLLARKLVEQLVNAGGKALILDRYGEYTDLEKFDVIDPCGGNFKLELFSRDLRDLVSGLERVFSAMWPDEFTSTAKGVFRESFLEFSRRTEAGDLKLSLNGFADFLRNCLSLTFESSLLRLDMARKTCFSLAVRLSELISSPVGEMLDLNGEQLKVKDLLSGNYVIDLTSLQSAEDFKSFTWLLLELVRSWRKAEPPIGNPHVIVIEDSHLVFPSKLGRGSLFVGDFIGELGRLNESIWMLDRVPSEISSEALSQLSTVVCLGVRFRRDVEAVSSLMHLTPSQADYLKTLRRGEAVALIAGTTTPIPVKLIDVQPATKRSRSRLEA